MTPQADFDAWLAETLADRRLSRNERRAVGERLGEGIDRAEALRRAFDLARETIADPDARAVVDWLEEMTRATRETPAAVPKTARASAHFSPGDDCLSAVTRFLAGARRTLDICVFTITDDRVADAIVAADRRGVEVRIVTDNDKAEDLGSDIDRLEASGVPVRVDRTPFHMHHKFAVADGSVLLTGSYNWTRGAARDNQENLVVTDDPRLIEAFLRTFERLWTSLE